MVLVRDSQMGKVSGRFCVRGWDHRRTSTVRLSLGRETQKGKVADWVRGGACMTYWSFFPWGVHPCHSHVLCGGFIHQRALHIEHRLVNVGGWRWLQCCSRRNVYMTRCISSFTVGGRWFGFNGTVGVCPSGCSSVTPAELGWEGASDPGVIGAISFFIFFGGILGGGHRSWVP
ncbi:hypothetical protein Dimus_027686 [Dionaea muscipula]